MDEIDEDDDDLLYKDKPKSGNRHKAVDRLLEKAKKKREARIALKKTTLKSAVKLYKNIRPGTPVKVVPITNVKSTQEVDSIISGLNLNLESWADMSTSQLGTNNTPPSNESTTE